MRFAERPFREDALTTRDGWRLPAAYLYTLELSRSGWAWEFLRRSPEFQADHAAAASTATKCTILAAAPENLPPTAVVQTRSSSSGAADPLRRWGLHFRAGPRPPS